MDQNQEKAIQAAAKWGGEPFISIQDAARFPVDVVAVVTPDDTHEEVLKQLIGWPRLVFAEKPFARESAQAEKILENFNIAGQSVCVNYTRRFSRIFQDVSRGIRRGDLGDFLGGAGFYGNGLYHSGSHMIDLLRMFLGEVKAYEPGSRIIDAKFDDPSVFGFLSAAGSPFYFSVIPRQCVNAFEAKLYFTKGIVSIQDIGREIYLAPTEPRLDFPEEMVYGESRIFACDDDDPMLAAVENISSHLIDGKELLCTGRDALEVLKICDLLAGEKVSV